MLDRCGGGAESDARQGRIFGDYPAGVRRNVHAIVRALDALPLSGQEAVSTPVNWADRDDAIISPAVSDDDAKQWFPQGFRTLRP